MCIYIFFSFILDWNITAAQVSATRDREGSVCARDSPCEFRSERFTECKFLSSTLMFCGLTAREEKASQSFSYKAPLSFHPSPLVLPLLTATLIPFSLPACLWWDWFCRLGEYFMLWCYIQQLHSTAPLIRKCKVLLLLKEVKNPFICPWSRLSPKYICTPNSHL